MNKLEGIQIVRQREIEALQKMREEEELEDMECRMRWIDNVNRISSHSRFERPIIKDDGVRDEYNRIKLNKLIESIDTQGKFVVIDCDGNFVYCYDNLENACKTIGLTRINFLTHIALRKPFYDLLIIEEKEYMDSYMDKKPITFTKGNPDDDIRSKLYEPNEKDNSNEHNKQNKKYVKDRKSTPVRPVKCIETGLQYNSMREAYFFTGIYKEGISYSAYTGTPVKGIHFSFIDENEYIPHPVARVAGKTEYENNKSKIDEDNALYKTLFNCKQFILVEETMNVYSCKSHISKAFNICMKSVYGCLGEKHIDINGYHIRTLNEDEYERLVFGESNGAEMLGNRIYYRGKMKCRKPVRIRHIDTGIEYKSISSFAKAVGLAQNSVSYAISKNKHNIKGIEFELIY